MPIYRHKDLELLSNVCLSWYVQRSVDDGGLRGVQLGLRL